MAALEQEIAKVDHLQQIIIDMQSVDKQQQHQVKQSLQQQSQQQQPQQHRLQPGRPGAKENASWQHILPASSQTDIYRTPDIRDGAQPVFPRSPWTGQEIFKRKE